MKRLIFTIQQHKVFGIIFESFWADFDKEEKFSFNYKKINALNAKSNKMDFSETELKLLELIEIISPDEITKRFSKDKTKPSIYYSTVNQNIKSDVIFPFIEKRLVMILKLIKEKDLPLFPIGTNGLILDRRIKVFEKEITLIPCFKYKEKEIFYNFLAEYKGKKIKLLDSDNYIITNIPCYSYIDNSIFLLPEIEGKKIQVFFKKDFIEVPEHLVDNYFKTFIAKTIANQKIINEGFEVNYLHYAPICNLKLTYDWLGNAIAVASFSYHDIEFEYNSNKKRKVIFQESPNYIFNIIERDFKAEENLIKELKTLELNNISGSAFTYNKSTDKGVENNIRNLVAGINEIHDRLIELNITVKSSFTTNYYTGKVNLNKQLTSKNDWFDLQMLIKFNDFEIPFINLKDHILNQIPEFVLPDGSVFVIPDEWFATYLKLFIFGNINKNTIRLNHFHVSLIERDFKKDLDILNINSLEKDDVTINSSTTSILRPYQSEGVIWLICLYKLKLGACLADDMGLGKTLQVLTLLNHHKNTNVFPVSEIQNQKQVNQLSLFINEIENQLQTKETKTSLVVMPLSLIYNWVNEIEKYTPNLKYYIYNGNARNSDPEFLLNFDIILSTYRTVSNDIIKLRECKFFYLILDESQFVKNAESITYGAISSIDSFYKLIMTGTPIENSINDLWSQMNLINKGLLGSQQKFKKYFVNTLENAGNPDESQTEVLKKLVKPFILRRQKVDVAKDLPELSIQYHYCEMSEYQQIIYETRKSEIRNFILEKISGNETKKVNSHILSGLTKLRLLANHPKLTEKDYLEDSGKTDEIFNVLESILIEGHKVLIFSQFTKYLSLISEILNEKQVKHCLLTGRQKTEERQMNIALFNENPEYQLFLISLKAGGVGLNLTTADYVFLLDPWWNPAVELQAINRAHRIGQLKNVFAYRFVSKGSIEEKIIKLQEKKQHLADIFINKNATYKFNKDDLLQLLD